MIKGSIPAGMKPKTRFVRLKLDVVIDLGKEIDGIHPDLEAMPWGNMLAKALQKEGYPKAENQGGMREIGLFEPATKKKSKK